MNFLNWNIKSVGQEGFQTQVEDLTNMHNHDIIILMDTTVNTNRAQQIIQSLDIPKYVEISLEGISIGYGYYGHTRSLFN